MVEATQGRRVLNPLALTEARGLTHSTVRNDLRTARVSTALPKTPGHPEHLATGHLALP